MISHVLTFIVKIPKVQKSTQLDDGLRSPSKSQAPCTSPWTTHRKIHTKKFHSKGKSRRTLCQWRPFMKISMECPHKNIKSTATTILFLIIYRTWKPRKTAQHRRIGFGKYFLGGKYQEIIMIVIGWLDLEKNISEAFLPKIYIMRVLLPHTSNRIKWDTVIFG